MREAIVAALDHPAPPAAHAILAEILARHGEGVAVVLFYGSCRRDGDGSGLLDLYVLYDRHRRFHRGVAAAMSTAILPPHVSFVTAGTASAKVAHMSCRQFERRVLPDSLDTTIWARFCQPATLLHARDPAARRWAIAAVTRAVRTGAGLALASSPPGTPAAECWHSLFARTYAAELRPERRNRPALIHAADPAWFDAALASARTESPPRHAGRLAWLARRCWGRPLNLLRLVKAAYTAEDGVGYALAKLERHAGVHVTPSAWQRRHPLLAAPVLLWRIRRRRGMPSRSRSC